MITVILCVELPILISASNLYRKTPLPEDPLTGRPPITARPSFLDCFLWLVERYEKKTSSQCSVAYNRDKLLIRN